MKSRFVIAAASSGSGKTTLTLGLLRALRNRGLKVAPFKCGPDYIDPMWHKAASGVDSYNLDLFMSSSEHIRNLFSRFSGDADVSVAEGVMGMFDGFDKMKGSSADVAKILDVPVVLLVNAASTAYSVAATIYGFKNFCKDVKVAGVIFNNVASERHYTFLEDACKDAQVRCFGYLPRMAGMEMPSRYLGLSIEAEKDMERFVEIAAAGVEKSVDVDALLDATATEDVAFVPVQRKENRQPCIVAVARDEAFNFIYPANIISLQEHGEYDVDVKYFSPLRDRELPACDMLYLPGGYPELYADKLSANVSMMESIRDFAERGGKLLAECGGMIYLMRSVDGHSMCGVLPMDVSMEAAKLTLGYRTIKIDNDIWRGHEFHYSRVVNPHILPSVACQTNVKGKEVDTPVYKYKNVIAGYTHLYWGDRDIMKLWQK